MTNTRDKFNEAKHFLEEIQKASSDVNRFRYNLTAYLAAIRSITQIMQKEFSEKLGFSEWYCEKQTEMQNNAILKYLHRQRNITFHEHPILPYPIAIVNQIYDSMRARVIITGTGSNYDLSLGIVNIPVIPANTEVKYYFDDMPVIGKDVIAICTEGIDALGKIVDECESKFWQNND